MVGIGGAGPMGMGHGWAGLDGRVIQSYEMIVVVGSGVGLEDNEDGLCQQEQQQQQQQQQQHRVGGMCQKRHLASAQPSSVALTPMQI